MDVHVRERRLPGIGPQWQLPMSDGTTITVTLESRTERRRVDVLPAGRDEPALSLHLAEAEAVTLASVLSGVRYVFDSEPPDVPAGGVHVETVTIGAGSPAVGRRTDAIEVPSPEEARVLAVIRDDTSALIEEDVNRSCQPGDRLVIAGRTEPLRELRSYLVG